jgi:hypothetical protein
MNRIPIRAGCYKIPMSSADILFLFALVFVAALLVPPLLFVLPILFFFLLIFFFRKFFPLIGPKSEYILFSVSPRGPPY